MKHDDSNSAIDHFQRIVYLAQRLQPLQVAIYQHDWLCLAFGSWSLVAGRRQRSYRFSWDGRDGFISVFGPFDARNHTAAKAAHIVTERLGLGADVDPLQYVESFFQQNAAT